MNTGLIYLIYKMRVDLFELKSWRPVMLLNIGVKILAEVLTNRLRNVMPLLIGEH